MTKIEYSQTHVMIKRVTDKAVLVHQEDYDEDSWIPRTLLSTRSDENLDVGKVQTLSIQTFKLREIGWL